LVSTILHSFHGKQKKNFHYFLIQFIETGALAVGPMLQGLNKPINDLSRGATIEDIYNTVIITAIQSTNN
jgi:phosphotransacetylase